MRRWEGENFEGEMRTRRRPIGRDYAAAKDAEVGKNEERKAIPEDCNHPLKILCRKTINNSKKIDKKRRVDESSSSRRWFFCNLEPFYRSVFAISNSDAVVNL